jgi:hypothetical protein
MTQSSRRKPTSPRKKFSNATATWRKRLAPLLKATATAPEKVAVLYSMSLMTLQRGRWRRRCVMSSLAMVPVLARVALCTHHHRTSPMHSKTLVHRTVNRSSDLQEYRDKDLWVSLVQARLNPMPCFPIGVDSFLPNALENTDQESLHKSMSPRLNLKSNHHNHATKISPFLAKCV